MDPDETLKRMYEIAERAETDWELAQSAREFVELFGNLDGWLSKGGYLPSPWMPAAFPKIRRPLKIEYK